MQKCFLDSKTQGQAYAQNFISRVHTLDSPHVLISKYSCRLLWFAALAYDKDVGGLRGKAVAIGIFHMNYIKRTKMSHYW